MSKNMKEMANALKENKAGELKGLIGESFDAIVTNAPVAVIPEMVFKEYFLDYFKGVDRDANSPVLLKWLELAGGPYNEVMVIDDKTGEALYKVPAVYAKPIVDTKQLADVSFNNVLSEFNLRSNRIHADGLNYLNQELTGIDVEVGDKSVTTSRWRGIFKKYHTGPKTKASIPIINKDADLVDGLDYD